MQRITNSILMSDEHILMIKKPRRGWYAVPGGKMEQGETIKESAIREYREETDLHLNDLDLAGVFTFNIFDGDQMIQEWMMFTFKSNSYSGDLTNFCVEGELEWIPFNKVETLPMAEGDRYIFNHVLTSNSLIYGTFSYTKEYELMNFKLDPTPTHHD